jgi:hypothetical protein
MIGFRYQVVDPFLMRDLKLTLEKGSNDFGTRFDGLDQGRF